MLNRNTKNNLKTERSHDLKRSERLAVGLQISAGATSPTLPTEVKYWVGWVTVSGTAMNRRQRRVRVQASISQIVYKYNLTSGPLVTVLEFSLRFRSWVGDRVILGITRYLLCAAFFFRELIDRVADGVRQEGVPREVVRSDCQACRGQSCDLWRHLPRCGYCLSIHNVLYVHTVTTTTYDCVDREIDREIGTIIGAMSH